MAINLGRIDWSLQRDEDTGHRTYDLEWLVQTASVESGPDTVSSTPGLAIPGSSWVYGIDNDPFATCTQYMEVSPVVTKEPNDLWIVKQRFTTKPMKRCQDAKVENPLEEPPKISGTFAKFTREAKKDRFGAIIKTSSHELIRRVERDDNRPTVNIQMNIAILDQYELSNTIDTVNDAELWNLEKRKIKLSNAPWSKNYWGQCTAYYTITYEFEIDFLTFDLTKANDRALLDEGTKVLAPGGNPNDPRDFVRNKDLLQENGRVILDGAGKAWNGQGQPGSIEVEHYHESNFLELGIPAVL